MSEGPKPQIPESSSLKEKPADDAWCNAFIDGTSRLPQGFYGNSIYMARAFLNADAPDIRKFGRSKLSPSQIDRMALLAEGQHKKRKIEIPESEMAHTEGKPNRPNDLSIEHVWGIGKTMTQGRIGKFAQILNGPGTPATILYDHARLEPALLEKMRRAFKACTDALDSREGVAVCREYKALRAKIKSAYDLQQLAPQIGAVKERVHELIFKGLLDAFPENENPGIAKELSEVRFEFDWQ